MADRARCDSGLLESSHDCNFSATALRIEATAGHRIAARAPSQHFTEDARSPLLGVAPLFEDQDARAFTRYPAVAAPVEGPASLAGIAWPARHRLEQRHPDQAE